MERSLRQLLRGGKFVVTPTRSRQMAAVRGKGNKTTEWRLRAAFVKAKISGWTIHPKGVVGVPDFYFPKQCVAVFVDGCFWHGCSKCGHTPKTNRRFWNAKILRNRARDRQKSALLRMSGIRVLRFWEHEIKTNVMKCAARVKKLVDKRFGKACRRRDRAPKG